MIGMASLLVGLLVATFNAQAQTLEGLSVSDGGNLAASTNGPVPAKSKNAETAQRVYGGVSGEPQFVIYTIAVLGPHPSRPGANSFATNLVQQWYKNGSVANALDYRLKTEYIAQPADLSSNTIWFVTRVVAKDPAFKFTPDNLRFIGKSSDSGNVLGKTEVFNTLNYIYTAKAMGVNWSAAGRGVSDSLQMSGSYADVPVNEFITAGVVSKYFNFTDSESYANLDAALQNQPDFRVTGTWQLMQGSTVLVSASKTLRMKSNRIPVQLTISPQPMNKVRIGVVIDADDSCVLEMGNECSFATGSDQIAVLSGTQTVTWDATASQMFFRTMYP